MEEWTKGEMCLKQQARGTTRLDTGESVIFHEWQEMARKAEDSMKKPSQEVREGLILESSPQRQKPKVMRRARSKFFTSAGR